MNNRIFVLPVVIAISAAFVGAAATPAMAAEAATCTTTPVQIREIAAAAQPEQARKALSLVRIGEKLCDAGARNEAGRKFAAAAKALGTDVAALNTAPVAR
jgi:hypothetical protein